MRRGSTSHQFLHEVPVSHLIAAVLQSDSLLGQLQREIYRAVPGVSVDQLRQILRDQILRADMINGPKANEAEALLQRAQQLRPFDPAVQLNLAYLLTKKSDFRGAALHYRRVLQLDPANSQARQALENLERQILPK